MCGDFDILNILMSMKTLITGQKNVYMCYFNLLGTKEDTLQYAPG